MSSLDYTYDNIDKLIDRSAMVSDTIDPKKTLLLVLDMQKACVTPGGAMYIESIAGINSGGRTGMTWGTRSPSRSCPSARGD